MKSTSTPAPVSATGRAPPMPKSPFFRPSNPRLSKIKSPHGTQRASIVVKKEVGGEPQEFPLQDLEKKTSLLGAYANLCNICIGAGIVGLPYAIKEAGLVSGVTMIVIVAIITDYSLRQVINTGKLANVNSYETLMEAAFGRPGFIFLALNMFFLSYGSMIAYLIIIKDVLPVLFHVTPHDVDIKRVIMFVSSLLVIVPLSMQRDMADLEKTSRCNVLLNICLVALVAGFSPVNESVEAHGGILQMIMDEPLFDLSTFFVGFGVCSFAFVCQDCSFIVAGSMKTPSKQRWKRVTNWAMITCCTLELTMGISGYLAYQTNTLGNVLNNMNAHHWSGVASRAILTTTMFFAYPMNLYVARHACVVLFFQGTSAHEGDDSIVLMRKDRRVILTWVLYIITLIPALLMESTGKVLSVTGAIAGSSLAYIVPGMTYLAIHSNEFIYLVQKQWHPSAQNLFGYPRELDSEETGEELHTSQRMEIVSGKGTQHENVGYQMETSNHTQIPRASRLGALFWYVFGMPIWSIIAQIGQRKLAQHFEKEDLVSPSVMKPKRVSVVKPTWHPPASNQEQSGVNVSQIARSSSDTNINKLESRTTEQTPLLGPKSGLPTTIVAGNDGVAKMIANNNQKGGLIYRTNSLTPEEIENELHNDVPTRVDFLIAIAYILLGVVAMIWGVVSVIIL